MNHDATETNVGDSFKPQLSLYIPKELETINDIRWEHLLEYDGTAYHLLLEKNRECDDCVENRLLQNTYQAQLAEDDEREDFALFDCLDVFWPFILTRKPNLEADSSERVKLQVRTMNENLHCTSHSLDTFDADETSYFIEDTFEDVEKVRSEDVDKLEEITPHIYKVSLKRSEETYVLKTVLLGKLPGLLRNEIETLMNIRRHENIVHLAGLTVEQDGKISGLLLPFVEGKHLDEIDQARKAEKAHWIDSIKNAVRHVHTCGRVWGDAKPGNIFITDNERNVVLFDFEGGFTPGWVDKQLHETRAGDWQGVNNIITFINKIPER